MQGLFCTQVRHRLAMNWIRWHSPTIVSHIILFIQAAWRFRRSRLRRQWQRSLMSYEGSGWLWEAEGAAASSEALPPDHDLLNEKRADEEANLPCPQNTDVILTERININLGIEPGCPPESRIGGEGSALGSNPQGSPPLVPAPSQGNIEAGGRASKRGGRRRGPRKQVQPHLADPAHEARSSAPAFNYAGDEERLRAGVRAQRGSSKPGGDRSAHDSHLPKSWRLGSDVWARANTLPSEASLLGMAEDDVLGWSAFLGRVLPRPDVPPLSRGLLAYGCATSIHNEDGCDLAFPPEASRAERTAALSALGWPRLPSAKRLKQHMLQRVEHEYAEHLLEHGYMPRQWCDECKCICAPAVDAHVAAAADPDPTHDSDGSADEAPEDLGSRSFDHDGALDIDDGSLSDLDDPTDA